MKGMDLITMAFNYDEIYEALKAGATPEDLAKDFTQSLNAAEKQHKADLEAEKAAKEAEMRNAVDNEMRLAAAEVVIEALTDYYKIVHPDWSFEFNTGVEDVANLLDSAIDIRKFWVDMMESTADMWNGLFSRNKHCKCDGEGSNHCTKSKDNENKWSPWHCVEEWF